MDRARGANDICTRIEMDASALGRTAELASLYARACNAVRPRPRSRRLYYALASLALLAGVPVVAQTNGPKLAAVRSAPDRAVSSVGQVAAPPAHYVAIRDYIRHQLVATGAPSLAIAVVRNGHIGWQEGLGWAGSEGQLNRT